MMKSGKRVSIALCAVAVMACGMSNTWAAKPAAEVVPLTATGNQLEARYSQMLSQLKAELAEALPKVDEKAKTAYLAAHKAEMAAVAGVEKAKKDFGDLNKAKGLIDHANWWIKDAQKQAAKAQADLKKATTDADRETLQKKITEQKARQAAGEQALIERQAAYEKAKLEQDRLNKALDTANAALATAKANAQKALEALNPESFLSSNALDAKLIKHEVLSQATPRGLATFAGQGSEHEALIESLLANEELMRQMVLADGPVDGKYANAIEIYTNIQKASPKAAEGLFQRLAMATSLEHATPIKQSNPSGETGAPATVDPVNRYLAFEKAYLAGELDPAFKNLTTWDLRYVVNGDEPDHILAWGREMLRNYRPDIVANPDYNWRYVQSVPTEVQYGSQDVKNDLPTLQPYQNMIMNGGICGRRAFFGRFILRSFGIPTTARPQPGHAALAHWTPKGWVINLGAGWGSGWTRTIYGDCQDFLAETQVRNDAEGHLRVQRALWIGKVLGESRAYGFGGKKGAKDFWNVVGISHRAQVIAESKAETLAAVGEELGESNANVNQDPVDTVKVTADDQKITVSDAGVITIPAAAVSKKSNRIKFMPSNLGGTQLHYSRGGAGEPFEYTVDAPAAGKYALTARVVVTSDKQHLFVAANGAQTPVDIAIPFTVGMWDSTAPVELTLNKGKNVLTFSRNAPVKGLTIKDFTLTPVK